MKYQTFIGLEVHIQLLTNTKIFCGCRNSFGDEPNTNVCPVCMGYPGVLPSLNQEAVRMSYLVAMALNCHLNKSAVFERKNYYYPDLPKNYQISQFEFPFGTEGSIDLEFPDGRTKKIRFHDVHLEEDAGKMIHEPYQSLLDYNRTGTPLLEVVTEPDLETGEEAELFLQQFRRMIRYLGVCDGNMEEGSMRCDANISINEPGLGLGRKAEVKNLNSSRNVRRSLEHEIKRQTRVLQQGGQVVQETRLWDESAGKTSSMRSKESAHDYRYFPEPDLPPYSPTEEFLAEVKTNLVELPLNRKKRLKEQYGLTDVQAVFIHDEKATADFFEETVNAGAAAGNTASWLSSDIQKYLNRNGLEIQNTALTPKRLSNLIKLIEDDKISNKMGKEVLEHIFTEDQDPEVIVKSRGMEQVGDLNELEKIIDEIFTANPGVVEAIRAGEKKQIGFIMGQVMKATGGSASPKLAQQIIGNKLK